MSATTIAILVNLLLVVAALGAALFTERFLKGALNLENKWLRATGSIAVFILTWVMLQEGISRSHTLYAADEQRTAELDAAQPVRTADAGPFDTIYLAPSAQWISQSDFSHLDRNRYAIAEELGLAIEQPVNDDWEVGLFPGFDTISTLDLTGAKVFSVFSQAYGLQVENVFGVRRRQPYKIEFQSSSRIYDLPIAFNPFANPDFQQEYVDGMLRGFKQLSAELLDSDLVEIQQQISRLWPGKENIPDMKSALSDMTSSSEAAGNYFTGLLFAQALIQQLSKRAKEVYDGVFVTVLPAQFLQSLITSKLFPRRSTLEMAVSYAVNRGNNSFEAVENMYANTKRGVISFSTNTPFEDILINGQSRSGTANYVGFILADQKRAVLVELVYLSIGGPISEWEELNAFFKSLRLERQ